MKAKSLQHIAFLTGVPSTGTKSHILEQLNGSLRHARMPQGKTRILSVDMGIRNLAYCVIDVPANRHATDEKLRVQSWQRLDLLEKMRPEVITPLIKPALQHEHVADAVAQAVLKNSFTPAIMSKVALQVTQDFLAHKPDIVLIERQRFRSGGGSAIQEWTVRVNTLESMLWACFETLKASQAISKSDTFPAVHEVAPKRVASFWTASPDAHHPSADLFAPDLAPPELKVSSSSTAKASSTGKKEKIAVLRSWLDGSGGVSLDFSAETQKIADAFAQGVKRRKSKSDETGGVDPVIERETKLDDLADCVLQGAAWVRWEENRRAIFERFKVT